jgi:DNA polymerase/3'-5' exonuclease PolX
MKLAYAHPLANHWRDLLMPYCERVAVAGSVRRQKPEVHDIEIVAMPKPGKDLLGNPIYTITDLSVFLSKLIRDDELKIIKGGEKYQQFEIVGDGINLDLFLVTPPAQWGVIFTIRTGPWEFSKWIVTQRNKGGALPSNARVKDGAVWVNGEIIPMPEEADFFDFLGVPMREPGERKAEWGRKEFWRIV